MEFANNPLKEIREWLFSAFSKNIILQELYIIGSVLEQKNNPNDIDVVQKINLQNQCEMIFYISTLTNIKNDFEELFSIPLHITTFTNNEIEYFHIFMNKNVYLKII